MVKDDVKLTNHRKLERTVTSHSGKKKVPYIEVDFITPSGRADTFEFGGLCIMENMAYIVESLCYPNCSPSPDLPYLAAEKLVELICPAFGLNRLNVLALCDASLSAMQPGPLFYDTLIRIRDSRRIINRPEDVYAICDEAIIDFAGVTRFSEAVPLVGDQAIFQITGYFNDPQLQPMSDWLSSMIRTAIQYRVDHPTFILDIARGGKFSSNPAFTAFLGTVGSPLVTNDRGETTLADPRPNTTPPNYSTIWAIHEINAVFWGRKMDCELVPLCKSAGIVTDKRCAHGPWERNLDPTCAFGQMWRHWGLTGYTPS